MPLDAPVINTTFPATLIGVTPDIRSTPRVSSPRPDRQRIRSKKLGNGGRSGHDGSAINPDLPLRVRHATCPHRLRPLGCPPARRLAPEFAAAQTKVPKPPEAYDAQVRYRINADRNERVLQFEAMIKFFGGLGFKETPGEDNDLAAFDPAAER